MSGIIAASSSVSSPVLIGSVTAAVLEIIGFWAIFHKAGRHGWAAIIPIYNLYTTCKVAGRPGWWWILFLIPLVNIVTLFVVYHGVAKNFGKGTLYGILLVLFTPIVCLVLGLGSSTYVGEAPAKA